MIKNPDPIDELYTRETYTTAEKLYKEYMKMRENVNDIYRVKYKFDDKLSNSEDFKKGFSAGVKIMMALFIDI